VTRVVVLLLVLGPFVRADKETALFFVKKGRDAATREDYTKAERWLQRALKEEKKYAPALLALAEVAQAQGNRDQAISHLEACVAGDGVSDPERKAMDKARSQLKQLDAARFDFQRMRDAYVKKLAALATRGAKSNPDLARECWRLVLLVDPGNAEAKRYQGGGGNDEADEGIPLFNGRNLDEWTGSRPAWTVRDGHMFGRVADAANVTRHKHEANGKFTLVCEMRVLEDIGDDPLFGIVLGMRGSYDHFGLWIWPKGWRLEHQTGEHERDELARRTFRSHKAKYDRFAWNTYRIDVDGKRITGFVNSKKIWSTSGAVRSLDGHVGCWVQEQSVEIRKLQLIEKRP